MKKNVNIQQKNRIMYNLGCVCIDFSSKIIKKFNKLQKTCKNALQSYSYWYTDWFLIISIK